MTIAYLNTKIGKFDNKIPNVSGLFKNKTKQTNKQTKKIMILKEKTSR